MIEQLVSLDFITAVSLRLDFFVRAIDAYFSGANNLKVVSIVLMLLALILFLFLIIVIYVRNIIYFVKSNNPQKNIELEDDSEDEDNMTPFNTEEREELERELQKELEMALAERRAAEQRAEEEQREKQKRAEEQQRQKEIKEEQKKQKKEEKKLKNDKKNESSKKEKNLGIDFDWQKGKLPPAEAVEKAGMENISLSYRQNRMELNQMLGLVIDMLGRGVDELKIAQTLNFKNQGLSEENEILKNIDAVKSFISLCISGKFAQLEQYENLPQEEDALYHLASGDPSLALALIENLMDTAIDKANAAVSEDKRHRLYTEVSGYACCFGALAETNDIMLATSAYELAIELLSSNVVAWSRLGDVYKKASSMPKAVWAYQNVLNFADGEIDILQIANANKNLSEHLYAEGNSLQAAKLYNSAKQYYDSLGINRRLDKQEIEIVEIIESNWKNSLPEMIQKLLGEKTTSL